MALPCGRRVRRPLLRTSLFVQDFDVVADLKRRHLSNGAGRRRNLAAAAAAAADCLREVVRGVADERHGPPAAPKATKRI